MAVRKLHAGSHYLSYAAYGVITPDNCLAFIFLPMESHTVVKYQSIITKTSTKIINKNVNYLLFK